MRVCTSSSYRHLVLICAAILTIVYLLTSNFGSLYLKSNPLVEYPENLLDDTPLVQDKNPPDVDLRQDGPHRVPDLPPNEIPDADSDRRYSDDIQTPARGEAYPSPGAFQNESGSKDEQEFNSLQVDLDTGVQNDPQVRHTENSQDYLDGGDESEESVNSRDDQDFLASDKLDSIVLSNDPKPKERLNVLFIVSDDLRPQLSSYVGSADCNPLTQFKMHTPNLDNLAKRSIQMNHAYVQFSVCAPSRSSYMTSRRPDVTGVWDITTYWRESGGDFTTLPQYFKENGYSTGGFGKIYHPMKGHGGTDPPSWSLPYEHGENGLFYQMINDSWWAVPKNLSDNKPLMDEVITERAIEAMAKLAPKALSGEENFFMGVGFQKPHIPFVFPERFMDHYRLQDMDLLESEYVPHNLPKEAWFHSEPHSYQDISQLGNFTYNSTMPKDAARALRRAYFACVSYVDDLVGRLVKAVDNLGLTDKTIISFIGDHGYHLGENGIWGKHTNLEQATRAPMMFHIPGRIDKPTKSSAIVEFVDLFPTLVEAAGLDPIPPCPKNSSEVALCTQGRSLLPLIDKPGIEITGQAISQMNKGAMGTGYSLRTSRYRYTEWPLMTRTRLHGHRCRVDVLWDGYHAKELYDHKADPTESFNVIGNNDKQGRKLALQLREEIGYSFELNC